MPSCDRKQRPQSRFSAVQSFSPELGVCGWLAKLSFTWVLCTEHISPQTTPSSFLPPSSIDPDFSISNLISYVYVLCAYMCVCLCMCVHIFLSHSSAVGQLCCFCNSSRSEEHCTKPRCASISVRSWLWLISPHGSLMSCLNTGLNPFSWCSTSLTSKRTSGVRSFCS